MTAIETPPVSTNGHAEPVDFGDLRTLADRLDREVAEQCDGLRRMLEAEQGLRAQVETVLNTISTREKRLQRALAVLEGTAPSPGRRPKQEAAQTQRKPSWTVGEDKVQKVRVALGELGEARVSQIKAHTGVSVETARRAVDKLREREQARVVRRNKQYGDTFALMPEEPRDAA